MASLAAGLVGGLVATVIMTALMSAMGDGGPPPTAMFVAKFAGGDPAEHAMPGMALHFLYGIGAGGVLAVGAPLVGVGFGSIAVAVGVGLVYGLVLMLGGMGFWMRGVLGVEPDKGMIVMFGTVHVVYGVVLGGFLGAGLLG